MNETNQNVVCFFNLCTVSSNYFEYDENLNRYFAFCQVHYDMYGHSNCVKMSKEDFEKEFAVIKIIND
jgi:hypothetical protein